MTSLPFAKTAGIVLILLTILKDLECSKILFLLPVPAKSHYTTSVTLAKGLAERGHKVTVISTYAEEKPVQNLHQITMNLTNTFADQMGKFNLTDLKHSSSIGFASMPWLTMPSILGAALASPEMKSLINSQEHFDLVMAESSFYQPCLVAFGHKFNAPFIDLSSTASRVFTSSITGNPTAFSYIPDTLLAYTDTMSFIERLDNAFIGVYQLIGEKNYYAKGPSINYVTQFLEFLNPRPLFNALVTLLKTPSKIMTYR